MKKPIRYYLLLLLVFLAGSSFGQNIFVNLDMLDGIEVTPANVFNMQIVNNSGAGHQVKVTGSIRYRNSKLRIGYTFNTSIQPGINNITRDRVSSLSWNFSDAALRELFLSYSKLPEGTYEYCASLSLAGQGSETTPATLSDACIYNTSNDIFLINLVDPNNNAKLHESYPMLSWMVNYPFASALTYKIRVAELKQGQNAQNAVNRNPPMFQDNNVSSTSILYPVTAKPLEKWQPYVWTVDAYYKGILLGGAEVWKFIIVDDSILKALPHETYYVDITKEKDLVTYYAAGIIKIKYTQDAKQQEKLKITLRDKNGTEIKMKQKELDAVLGDNRYEIDLKDYGLKHLDKYQVTIINSMGAQYTVPVTYINPDFL
jgi:hypothetical protein